MRNIFIFLVSTFGFTHACAQVDTGICQQSVLQLQAAVTSGETFFIKVHAAENLIYHHQTEGLEFKFLQLKQASPDNVIGSLCVLARLNSTDAKNYNKYIGQLLAHFKHGSSSKEQLTALESLSKLGYDEPLETIKAYADTGSNGFKGMARWLLSNNGSQQTENQLSELLMSKQEIDYRYAAYALRFKLKVNALTVKRLKQCLQSIQSNNAARVYVCSSLFVHSDVRGRKKIKPVLIQYLAGTVGERCEVAEALNLGGGKQDLHYLTDMLKDQNTDVMVAAANAILKIMNCKN